ncbi:hypothetical protein, partial [Helicobacter sp. T3_23-1056]
QINRDISGSRAQYDKENSVIASNDSTFVIADNDSTSVITDKYSASVIASECNERGNPHYDIDKVDCHANAVAFARNDKNANFFNDKIANSRNDYNHSVIAGERSERGNLQDNIETIDCHALDSAKMQNLIARNDGIANSFNDKIANFASAKSTHPQTPSAREGVFKAKIQTTAPKKRLALSIATASLIASLSLDTIAAQVNCRTTVDDYTPGSIYNDFDGRTKVYTCSGYADWTEMTGSGGEHLHHTYETNQYWDTTVQFGTASERLTIGGGSHQIDVGLNRFRGQGALGKPYDYKKGFYKYIEFGLLDAKDMSFRITSQGQVQASVKTIAQANIGSLILASDTTTEAGDRGNWTYNWDGKLGGIFQHITIGHSSTIGTIKVDKDTRMVYNMDIKDNANIGNITNSGNLTNLRIDNATASTIKNESGAWLGTV